MGKRIFVLDFSKFYLHMGLVIVVTHEAPDEVLITQDWSGNDQTILNSFPLIIIFSLDVQVGGNCEVDFVLVVVEVCLRSQAAALCHTPAEAEAGHRGQFTILGAVIKAAFNASRYPSS